MAKGASRAVVAAFAVNIAIACIKLIAYILTHSSSMLAESIHSLADSGNQLLLLLGGKKARRKANSAHPFGYGRERYIYAFLVSLVLFTVGGISALKEAWEKLQDPHGFTSQWWWMPLVVLIGSLALEARSFVVARAESERLRGGRSWMHFIRAARAPELPVVLLEDSAALLGLSFALFGVTLTIVTGNGVWDAIGTALIGALLIAVAAVLAVKTKSMLVGEAAEPEKVAALAQALLGPGIEQVIHLRTLHLAPDELLVVAKIAIDPAAHGDEIAQTIDAAEARVRRAVPIATVVYVEPDIQRIDTDRKRG